MMTTMTSRILQQFTQPAGSHQDRRAAVKALGLAALVSASILPEATSAKGKNGKNKKKGKKKGQPPAPQDLVACQQAITARCLIGDPRCLTASDQCCSLLAAGETAAAVICILDFASPPL
jgi:hypothetical protein